MLVSVERVSELGVELVVFLHGLAGHDSHHRLGVDVLADLHAGGVVLVLGRLLPALQLFLAAQDHRLDLRSYELAEPHAVLQRLLDGR